MRYPITLRKDFNVFKVIKRNKNYKIYTDFYSDLIFYVDKTQYMVAYIAVLYLGIYGQLMGLRYIRLTMEPFKL